MEKLICQCCDKNEAIGVASSTMGAFSVAYCQKCLDAGVEPLWALVATAASCGEIKDGKLIGMADWFYNTLDNSLKYFNYSYETFIKEVEAGIKDYDDYCNNKENYPKDELVVDL